MAMTINTSNNSEYHPADSTYYRVHTQRQFPAHTPDYLDDVHINQGLLFN